MPARRRSSRRTSACRNRSPESGSRKSFHPQWLTLNQLPSVRARLGGGRFGIKALRRTYEVGKGGYTPRQLKMPMRSARSFQRSTRRLSAGSFIATRPIVGRRASLKPSARQRNANAHPERNRNESKGARIRDAGIVAELKARRHVSVPCVAILLARMAVPKSAFAYRIERIDSGK